MALKRPPVTAETAQRKPHHNTGRKLTPEQRAKSAPKRPSKVRTTKIDWFSVRDAYVRGSGPKEGETTGTHSWPSLAVVAKTFGVSLKRTEAVSSRDGWVEQRETFKEGLRVAEDERMKKQLASQRVKSQMAFASTGQRIQSRADSMLRQDALTPRDLRSLAGATQAAQTVVETAMGAPPEGAAGRLLDWLLFSRPPAQVLDALPILEES